MKILVISDSHGNIANLKRVMGFGKKIGVKAVIHCGDWDNVAAVEAVSAYDIPIYSVLGNADIDPNIAKIFKRTYLDLKLGDRRIGVIHNIKHLVSSIQSPSILFFGHWQKQKEMTWNGIRAINPGALENDINFAVYDTKTDKVELIHE